MKGSLTLLSLVLAGAVFAAMPASGRQAASETKAAPAAKETKAQGNVVRIYKTSRRWTFAVPLRLAL